MFLLNNNWFPFQCKIMHMACIACLYALYVEHMFYSWVHFLRMLNTYCVYLYYFNYVHKCSVDPILCWAILCLITEILPTQQVHAAIPCKYITTACAIYWFLKQPLKSLLLHERDVSSQTVNVKFPYDQGMALTAQFLASLLPLPNSMLMYGMSKTTPS